MKEEISELLEQQVAGQGHSALKLQIQPQALNTVWNYVSASEWKQLQSCNSTDAVQILVRRLKASGLKSLKESTKKSGVALVVRLALQRGEAKPPAQEIYKLSMSFADSFHASTQAALVGGLATYSTLRSPVILEITLSRLLASLKMALPKLDAQVACGVASLMKSIKVRSSNSEINAPQPKAPRLEDKPSWSPGKMMATCMDTMQTNDGHRNLDVPEPTVHLLKKVLPKHPQRLLKPHLHNRILPVAVPKLCLACLPLTKLKRRQQKKTH